MHQHVAGLQGEVLQTNEPGTDGRGLQAGEAAGGVVRVADQRQAKVQATQGQTDLIGGAGMNARKGRHVVTAYGDELGLFNDGAV